MTGGEVQPATVPVLQGRLSLRAELRILGGFFHRRMAEFFSNRTNTIFGLLQITCAAIVFEVVGNATPALGWARVAEACG